jgi:hypothetical protein
MARAEAAALDLVTRHAGEIERLAAALDRAGQLTGKQALQILGPLPRVVRMCDPIVVRSAGPAGAEYRRDGWVV